MSYLRRSQLTDQDRIRLDTYVRRFSDTWNAEQMGSVSQSLTPHLPEPGDPLRLHVLQALVINDLTRRWRSGQKVRVEYYLAAFPELAEHPEQIVELIFAEFSAREQLHEPVDVHSYQERFPTYFDQLYQYVRSQQSSGQGSGPVGDTVKAARPMPADGKTFVPDFSRYELIRKLGAGQFGEVWLAQAPGGVDVALKIIPWPSAHKMSQMELRALEVMKRLRHAFLLQVHAYWPMENQVAIVLELADGSLEDRLKECRAEGEPGIPRDELLSYMRESAEAIDFLHEQNVLHRDIKPANILLVQGHAKVGDFGVARLVGAEPIDASATCVGTPNFMAPEVWKNNVQPASDQYSLAISYVELRLGRPVFTANSLAELLESHTQATPDLAPIPASEQQVILKALAKRPEDRFADCSEFVNTLSDLFAQEARQESMRGEVRRRRIVLSGLLTLTAAAVAIPIWLFANGNSIKTHLDFPSQVTVAAGGNEQRLFVNLVAPPRQLKSLNADQLVIDGLPTEVEVDVNEVDGQPFKLQIRLRANLVAEATKQKLKLQLEAGDEKLQGEIELLITPPDAYLPPGAKKAPHAIAIENGGRIFWSHIYLELPDGEAAAGELPIEFVLIPRSNSTDPATFYIMKNKVWNALYSRYVRASDGNRIDERWRQVETFEEVYEASDYPLRPVYNLTVEDAHRFAVWLGGKLPTEPEWEKAAGRFDYHKPGFEQFQEGPYQGSWDPNRPGITVGDHLAVPSDVGTSTQDVTLFGVHDMAGNGLEYTSHFRRIGELNPAEIPITTGASDGRLVLKGKEYMGGTPLQYSSQGTLKTDYRDYSSRSPMVSFRVVIPVVDH